MPEIAGENSQGMLATRLRRRRSQGDVRRAFVGIVLAASFLFGATASAQVRGTIVGPGVRQYPIAVSELKSTARTDLASMFADIVSRDMELSGLFKVLPRASYRENANESGITPETIDFTAWSAVGALALVKGALHVEGDRVRVEARLFDVFQRRLLVGRNYHGGIGNLRRMAHRFADEILAQLTGERGPFDSKIAFVSTRGGRFKEIFTMSLDGGDMRQMTFNRTINLAPSWGPNGAVLFTSYQRGNPDLFRLDTSSGTTTRLAFAPGLNLGGEYSPDGSRIALSTEERGNPDIVLIDPSGRTTARVTDSWGIDVSPAWSPDGRTLAFCSNRAGGPQIYVAGVGGDAPPRRVTFRGDYNTSPAWSPKGDRIAYVSRVGGRFDIFTVRPDGGEPVRVTTGPGDNEDPSWSPDGRFLVFSSTRTGSKKLFIVRAEGGTPVQLTSGNGDDSSPTWSRWLD